LLAHRNQTFLTPLAQDADKSFLEMEVRQAQSG
jgi:hypothetical protein